jgi:RND family efflux transporter MFP subunit
LAPLRNLLGTTTKIQAADAVLATENNMKNARTFLVVGLSAALGMIIVEPVRAAAVLVENNRFSCVIEPYSTIELATSADGLLLEVTVDRGDRIEEGQLLARLDSSVEEAEVQLARVRAASNVAVESSRARLALQKARHKRNKDLAGQNMISLEKLEEIETEVELAEHDLRQAQVNKELEKLELDRAINVLERRTIRAPFDGVVMEKLLNAGEFADGNTKVLRVARMDPLRVQARLPAALYSGVSDGMRAEIYPSVAVGGTYAATVSDKDSVLDSNDSTFRVRLILENEDYALPAGVKCQVRFLPE